jgi:hypothetical protein
VVAPFQLTVAPFDGERPPELGSAAKVRFRVAKTVMIKIRNVRRKAYANIALTGNPPNGRSVVMIEQSPNPTRRATFEFAWAELASNVLVSEALKSRNAERGRRLWTKSHTSKIFSFTM